MVLLELSEDKMKTFLLIICILIASADGFIAVYEALRRTVWGGERRAFEKKNSKLVCVNPIDILDVGVVYELLGGQCQFSYPKAVCDNGGRTGRGNPHLTRNRYVDILSIDTQIERIIRQAHD